MLSFEVWYLHKSRNVRDSTFECARSAKIQIILSISTHRLIRIFSGEFWIAKDAFFFKWTSKNAQADLSLR